MLNLQCRGAGKAGVMVKSAVAERREMCVKDNMVVDICLILVDEDEHVIKEDWDRQYC